MRFVVIIALSFLFSSIVIFFVGCQKKEREFILKKATSIIEKLKKR